jgi:multidrug efflux system membrane fusion protein
MTIKKFLLPFSIVVGGFGLAAVIIATGPELEHVPPPSNAPLIRVWEAHPQTVQMSSITHGSVLPRTESDLIPEVSGRVVSMSPSLVSGGFFKKGDVLLEIDPLDYEVALEQARAALASSKSEVTNARKAHERQLDLAKKQSTSESQRDDALNRMQFAEAAEREARARLSRAERDIERTRITAPFEGRVRSERVDVGQFITRGASVASIYSTDFAEVRLPIHDEELAFLELPLDGIDQGSAPMPRAILRARFAGKEHQWEGLIVRTEGELDPQTRMVTVVAQVEAPYKTREGRPPLAVGLFVEAEIVGRVATDVYIVPRSALQANNQVYIINADNELVFRDVDILRLVDEDVYIRAGLESGEIVCLSTLSSAIEGMTVRPVVDGELPSS